MIETVEKPPVRCAVCNSLVKNEEDLWCGNCIYLAYGKIAYKRYKHKFAGAVAGAEFELAAAIRRRFGKRGYFSSFLAIIFAMGAIVYTWERTCAASVSL